MCTFLIRSAGISESHFDDYLASRRSTLQVAVLVSSYPFRPLLLYQRYLLKTAIAGSTRFRGSSDNGSFVKEQTFSATVVIAPKTGSIVDPHLAIFSNLSTNTLSSEDFEETWLSQLSNASRAGCAQARGARSSGGRASRSRAFEWCA